jgi:ATP:ADP antiporter, AAA family
MTAKPTAATELDDLMARLLLLTGQAFCLGLTLGLLIVAAFALLISTFGAGALPWVYIAVAIVGSGGFYSFAEAQRRWSLMQVFLVSEVVVVLFLGVAWVGLRFAGANWLSFAAMILFSLLLQIGFVILGGQAGRLLDVRQIKRYFARIVAGFVVGFMVAGALAAPLQRILGRTEHLLLAAAGAAALMLALLLVTNARYRQTLAQANPTGPNQPPPPLRKVLGKRFVLTIFAYQMLSAMVTQLLEYMVMTAAAERFIGSDALASFYGSFTFALNLTDLLFVALVAGFLMNRFGLKFGLTFNPLGVILLLIIMVAIGAVAGPMATTFFGSVLLTRILDITFTDGATRGSINATYQALPGHERVTVQTGVEGVGVPLALGATGVILLLFTRFDNVTLLHVAILTLVLSLLWLGSALLVYRDYAANLVKTMRRRALGDVGLILEDEGSLDAVHRLIASDTVREVRLGLELLQNAQHPSLRERLPELLKSDHADVQIEALTWIEGIKLQAALPHVQELSASSAKPGVQGAAIRTLCALEDADAVAAVVPYLDSPDNDLRLGAAAGLLRYGSTPGILAVGQRLPLWESSDDAGERCFLARLLEETALPHLYQPLIALLSDPDAGVRTAALRAAGAVSHPRLLPLLLRSLSDRATRAAALDALVAYGTLMLPVVDDALSNDALSEEDTVRLVRICLQIEGDEVRKLMQHHVAHPKDAVRDQVLAVLTACDYQPQNHERAPLNETLRQEVRRAHQLLRAQEDIVESVYTAPLLRALQDELTVAQSRIFSLLSFLYEAGPIRRAGSLLVKGVQTEKALAHEMLDVTLSSTHKALIFPIIDAKMNRAQRLRLLEQQEKIPAMTCDGRLEDLIRSSVQPWVRSCALYAVAQKKGARMVTAVESALTDTSGVVRETAAWSLHALDAERFNHHAQALMADSEAHVARLATKLHEHSSLA